MADDSKVVINLATGLEDAERVTVAFLVGGAALERGKQVAMFLTKEAVRLGLPGYSEAVACDGCPPLSRLFSAVRGRRRRAPRLPDLLQCAQAGRSEPRAECAACRSDAALGVGRRRCDGVQLLSDDEGGARGATEPGARPGRRTPRRSAPTRRFPRSAHPGTGLR